MGRVVGSAVMLGLLIGQQAFGCRPLLAASSIRITSCTLKAEDSTVNNRAEIVYYTCEGPNIVIFAVHQGSAGEMRLRELVNRTVDVGVEEIK